MALRMTSALTALTLVLAACGSASDDPGAAVAVAPTQPPASTTTTSTMANDSPTTTVAPDSAAEVTTTDVATTEATTTEADAVSTTAETLPDSRFLGDYTLTDDHYGTSVAVTVSGNTRHIAANALPNHETGTFPNANNPNTITAQNADWSFPVSPTWTGTATWAMVPGVSINGVKFEPETAESATCATGETYRIEALQDTYNLGFDINNAHVQPNGEYHYHGVSQLMVEAYNGTDADLVHVGFAADGHLMYYSKSGAHRSGYALSTTPRTGSNCQPTLRNASAFDLDGTMPDGTYVSDWEWSASNGDLDECNGTTIDGTYVYFITDAYPFVSRCLFGSFTPAVQPRP